MSLKNIFWFRKISHRFKQFFNTLKQTGIFTALIYGGGKMQRFSLL